MTKYSIALPLDLGDLPTIWTTDCFGYQHGLYDLFYVLSIFSFIDPAGQLLEKSIVLPYILLNQVTLSLFTSL